jgi:hypothetical protein
MLILYKIHEERSCCTSQADDSEATIIGCFSDQKALETGLIKYFGPKRSEIVKTILSNNRWILDACCQCRTEFIIEELKLNKVYDEFETDGDSSDSSDDDLPGIDAQNKNDDLSEMSENEQKVKSLIDWDDEGFYYEHPSPKYEYRDEGHYNSYDLDELLDLLELNFDQVEAKRLIHWTHGNIYTDLMKDKLDRSTPYYQILTSPEVVKYVVTFTQGKVYENFQSPLKKVKILPCFNTPEMVKLSIEVSQGFVYNHLACYNLTKIYGTETPFINLEMLKLAVKLSKGKIYRSFLGMGYTVEFVTDELVTYGLECSVDQTTTDFLTMLQEKIRSTNN